MANIQHHTIIIKKQEFTYSTMPYSGETKCAWTGKTIKDGQTVFYCSALGISNNYSSLSALKQAIIAAKGL